jgi:homoaconitate hydratase
MKETMEDELVFCNADNISTDGIYHGRHMYEDLSPARMAEVAMENYDPNFSTTLRARGTAILVAGANFGTGSSREQAAQALQHAGVAAVIAASFSATYTRNALNNGLPVFESPELVAFLRERCGAPEGQPTALPGLTVHLDLRAWQVRVDGERFPVVPLGHAAQELLAAGGLEAWIRERL